MLPFYSQHLIYFPFENTAYTSLNLLLFPLSYFCDKHLLISSCTQLCPTLCDPTDCSPPGSSVHGISQARIIEWVAISYSRFVNDLDIFLGFPGGSVGKESVYNAGDLGLILGWGRSSGEEIWQPIPVFLTGEFQGQSILVGYCPCGRRVRHN